MSNRINFEDFIRSKCPDILQTNNSPEGEDSWMEHLDGSEYEELGDEYGEMMYEQGRKDMANEANGLASNPT
jgi:hypothetical protein